MQWYRRTHRRCDMVYNLYTIGTNLLMHNTYLYSLLCLAHDMCELYLLCQKAISENLLNTMCYTAEAFSDIGYVYQIGKYSLFSFTKTVNYSDEFILYRYRRIWDCMYTLYKLEFSILLSVR